jgi:hypothetical protein
LKARKKPWKKKKKIVHKKMQGGIENEQENLSPLELEHNNKRKKREITNFEDVVSRQEYVGRFDVWVYHTGNKKEA